MDQGALGYYNFENSDVPQNESNLADDRHEDNSLLEFKIFKINERYFSTNDENEIKDSDLIIDDEEINVEITAEDEPYKLVNIKTVLVTQNEIVETQTLFFDNNYWSKNPVPGEEIMKELDII